jgi:hypothetical protein
MSEEPAKRSGRLAARKAVVKAVVKPDDSEHLRERAEVRRTDGSASERSGGAGSSQSSNLPRRPFSRREVLAASTAKGKAVKHDDSDGIVGHTQSM